MTETGKMSMLETLRTIISYFWKTASRFFSTQEISY